MLGMFHEQNVFKLEKDGATIELIPERLKGEKAQFDIVADGKTLVEEGKLITARHITLIAEANLKQLTVPDTYQVAKLVAKDLGAEGHGEILAAANTDLPTVLLAKAPQSGPRRTP